MVNKIQIIGRVGKDPEIKTFSNGNKVANFTVATSEKYKDKQTGEYKEDTEWHNIAIFGKLADVAESYVKKGALIYLEGKSKTRSWDDQNGNKKYMTEIVLSGFGSEMKLLSGKSDDQKQGGSNTPPADDFDDMPPF